MGVLDDIAGARYGYLAGVSGNATIPNNAYVIGVWAVSASGGSMTITPNGPNQVAPAAAGPSITLPAGVVFSRAFLETLGPGTTFGFTGTSSYFVDYVIPRAGK